MEDYNQILYPSAYSSFYLGKLTPYDIKMQFVSVRWDLYALLQLTLRNMFIIKHSDLLYLELFSGFYTTLLHVALKCFFKLKKRLKLITLFKII